MSFLRALDPGFKPPRGVSIMDPYADPITWGLSETFYRKYYSDDRPRIPLFGINPGRLGAGLTGIAFTDPVRLQEDCGIPNHLEKKPEMSAGFVHDMIAAAGGEDAFHARFFLTAVCPLGFIKDGKNMNYYDDPLLAKRSTPFIERCITHQLHMLDAPRRVFCMGEGENFKFLSRLNEKWSWFDEITPLPHSRWVMQYRSKRKEEFIQLYLDRLGIGKAQ